MKSALPRSIGRLSAQDERAAVAVGNLKHKSPGRIGPRRRPLFTGECFDLDAGDGLALLVQKPPGDLRRLARGWGRRRDRRQHGTADDNRRYNTASRAQSRPPTTEHGLIGVMQDSHSRPPEIQGVRDNITLIRPEQTA
ncbi:MAG TPA: hypothetical protein VF306_15315 [Pirellulales bacterium]